jgi:hypothetical protein
VQVLKGLRKASSDDGQFSKAGWRTGSRAGRIQGVVVAGTGPAGALSVPVESTDLTS